MTKVKITPEDYSDKIWIGIEDKFPKRIKNATTTSDGLMSAEDKAKLDAIDLGEIQDRVYDIVTWESDGLMTKDDKKKLDGIEAGANNYIHPNTSDIRHVTDAQITYWNAKASTDIATISTNGLMSYKDKQKLDKIEDYANNYIHPNTSDIRHVTDEQIKYWNEKASTDTANYDRDGLMSSVDKQKLDGIEDNANNYVHPDNEGIRHVTDAQITYWNAKANKSIVTNSENGLMSYKDKVKLDGIETGANNYTHPEGPKYRHVTDEQIRNWDSKSSAAIATTEANGLMSKEDKRYLGKLVSLVDDFDNSYFVTNEQIEKWNNKADISLASKTRNGLMPNYDKEKLDGIEDNANNYVHPNDENTRHVTDSQIKYWNEKASTNTVTQDSHGLMIAYDKKKLDNIESGANKYIHPDTPDIRHVTDSQISKWNAKADTTVVSNSKNGLMSVKDKNKLDNIAENANNYVHPETHNASMIIEDKDHRFVTDEEKERWNLIDQLTTATEDADGLMSVEDKKKLDQLIVPENHELKLVYSDWTDVEPYEQTLNVPGIHAGINAYIGINSSATVDEMTCAAEAKLKVGRVEEGKIVILATGKKPNMNLPIIVMAGSSVLIFEVNQFNGREEYADEAPTSGIHYENEIVYAFKPVKVGCIGWVCTKTGNPGEWQPFGIIETPK